jgi:pyruvate/2-oxoglutarate dehydrogenase complex dihydrolipoamide dehydrogenase (E3) component
MAERLTPDICVIGAGSGGLSLAAAAAAFGVPVVLIERGKMGGECLNTGCVPSKSLIAAGKRARAIADGGAFGVSTEAAEIDFAKVHRHVHGVIAAIAPNDSKARFNGLGVRVVEGAARFKDGGTVVVGATEIAARRFVIATGSSPALPPIAGLDGVPYLTNETIFDLATRPDHLIVIGAGAIGLELAQAFRLKRPSRSRAKTTSARRSCSTRSRARASPFAAMSRSRVWKRRPERSRSSSATARLPSKEAIF